MFDTASSECPVCRSTGTQKAAADGDGQRVTCGRCGRFEISQSATEVLAKHADLRSEKRPG